MGLDCFNGKLLLEDEEVREKVISLIRDTLNWGNLSTKLAMVQLVMLSKRRNEEYVAMQDVLSHIIRSYLSKIVERTLIDRINAAAPHIFTWGGYQLRFTKGRSVMNNVYEVQQMMKGMRRKSRGAIFSWWTWPSHTTRWIGKKRLVSSCTRARNQGERDSSRGSLLCTLITVCWMVGGS
jgi:hypothetical protein